MALKLHSMYNFKISLSDSLKYHYLSTCIYTTTYYINIIDIIGQVCSIRATCDFLTQVIIYLDRLQAVLLLSNKYIEY